MWRNIDVQIIVMQNRQRNDVGAQMDKWLGMRFFMASTLSIPNISRYIVYLDIIYI